MAMYILLEDGAVIQLELSTLSGHEPDKTSFKGTEIFSFIQFSVFVMV